MPPSFRQLPNILPISESEGGQTLLDVTALVASGLTIAVIVIGFVLTRRFWLRCSLVWSMWRSFRSAGVGTSSIPAFLAHVGENMTRAQISVGSELDWLCTLNRLDRSGDRGLPHLVSREEIRALANAYELFAGRLNSRTLLSANMVPFVGQYLDLAKETSAHLERMAASTPFAPQDSRDALKPTLSVPHRGLKVWVHAFPDRSRLTFAFELFVSFRSHLTVPAGVYELKSHGQQFKRVEWLKTRDDERMELVSQVTTGRWFDGLLSRLVHWELVRQDSNGRLGLQLSLASCSYSSVILDHYPSQHQVDEECRSIHVVPPKASGVAICDAVRGDRVGLLTLCAVPVTKDGYLVLVRRSNLAGSHRGVYGPAVSGNLELHPRDGEYVDFDDHGIPDLRHALSREAMEELGLRLDPTAFAVTGLVRFDSLTEKGTNLLMTTVNLPLTLREVQDATTHADPLEGRWELGAELIGIRIPRKRDEMDDVARWLVNSHDLSPHATIATLAAIAQFQHLDLTTMFVANSAEHHLDEKYKQVLRIR